MKQELVIVPTAVMSDFCYSFSRALLEELQELKANDRVYQKQHTSSPTQLAQVVIKHLADQLTLEVDPGHLPPQQLDQLLSTAEEFLAIFSRKM